jgi:hypothetical protein
MVLRLRLSLGFAFINISCINYILSLRLYFDNSSVNLKFIRFVGNSW